MMQNWMAGCGYIDEEPFVMIDCLSGRLRPLYVIDFRYHSESGVGGGVDNEGGDGDGDGDQSSDVFVPSMLDLVLSPQQRNACENAMAVKNEVSAMMKAVLQRLDVCFLLDMRSNSLTH